MEIAERSRDGKKAQHAYSNAATMKKQVCIVGVYTKARLQRVRKSRPDIDTVADLRAPPRLRHRVK